ncbi:2-amino-4-hydroxy-6-hydroxymethyldihydropteridine diphosphokinase [Neptunomonas antarctica]|uniref:2-amino-4-hydroxy-6-hydroxymethyldihydropteridine pyrophosphokinase n=1 Tax=Neptunomonas antarctica TaxID=619304 RepID=A0A1N7PLD2_9GAMM|nr:2-amino-4-hydroxy-6-hydroxymethyldihydropteridine diphosphokinase [Neptunomonas antarctica]SIT11435.1 2-amino-4-hydroxy-6-hydroxymethyldihydropteridinediphosphokinase [Neptunomonas antarctica]
MIRVTPKHCYIGLGSNLESPRQQVTTALEELKQIPGCTLLSSSSLYRSDPVGPAGQPDYVNAVALLDTALTPEALLDQLQILEQQHRRVRHTHWGPRTLDLDIIMFGDLIINSDRLAVPHPFAGERNFVLWPLSEISPGLIFPDGRSINDLLVACPLGTLEKISV